MHSAHPTDLNTFVQHKLLRTSLVWRWCRRTSGRVARSLHSSCTHYIQCASKLNSILHTHTHAPVHLPTFIVVPFTTCANLNALEILLTAYGCCWCHSAACNVHVLSLHAKQHGPPSAEIGSGCMRSTRSLHCDSLKDCTMHDLWTGVKATKCKRLDGCEAHIVLL